MKRIVISVVLLAICFASASAELVYVKTRADAYFASIDEIDGYMLKNDFENALNKCTEIDNSWSSTAERIDIMLIHDYVDGIGLSIAQMKAHIENGNPDMYFAESASAKNGLDTITRSEYPYLENLL